MGDYNGWKNHTTWHINLILTNDQATLTEAQKVSDQAYYRARFEHFLNNRVEGELYDNWAESDRAGIFGAADRLKGWAEGLMETMVDLDTTARPPDITPARMRTTAKRIAQLKIQGSMRLIAKQAIQDALDGCDWVEIAEAFDERRKETLAYHFAETGPREEAV
jgi:hypothetical protein